jgi:hypothetical protein
MFSILSLLKKVNDVLFAVMDDMLSISLEFSHHNGGKKSSKRDIRPKNLIFNSF